MRPRANAPRLVDTRSRCARPADILPRASGSYAGPMESLEGRVVAIAGIAGGLGPVVAERLAGAGAAIAGTDTDQGRIDEVGAALGLPAERWDGRAVDLLDEGATRAWCAGLLERFGQV